MLLVPKNDEHFYVLWKWDKHQDEYGGKIRKAGEKRERREKKITQNGGR